MWNVLNENPALAILAGAGVLLAALALLLWRFACGVRRSLRALAAQTRRDNAQANQTLSLLTQSLGDAAAQLTRASEAAGEDQEKLRLALEGQMEQMRKSVDSRLQTTLEARLGESFRAISEQLERVHRGLGEMNTLAAGVEDLRRVFSNVTLRGAWGEVRLSALLSEALSPGQYAANVHIEGANRVEFAIRMPGREEGDVYLPIDSKFPQEDYRRLVEASQAGDAAKTSQCAAALERAVLEEARRIRDKYIKPPKTTDFAIMFLPVESLYAEVLKRPGLCERMQREFRVTPCGPTTLAALLNSLQMGFRTVAIERRTAEVWQLLGAVRTEFARYGEAVDKARARLQGAMNDLDSVDVRARAVSRKLRGVGETPEQPPEAGGEG
ncbi:MAG TPA: DNA recombination protein RmuC [Candidatus Ornithocaccomicrobium faecavium]|uniref:DNA recombination protein RmuC n=1 Tax=Candidatus Ornithocaccomicrobium faecavium TaxID=2840890 RepID=A0A9D1PBK0_9FIRM|nr:DNA recombination protein RmuC [Candidatus Ornithocaccomicrobium faecavium]